MTFYIFYKSNKNKRQPTLYMFLQDICNADSITCSKYPKVSHTVSRKESGGKTFSQLELTNFLSSFPQLCFCLPPVRAVWSCWEEEVFRSLISQRRMQASTPAWPIMPTQPLKPRPNSPFKVPSTTYIVCFLLQDSSYKLGYAVQAVYRGKKIITVPQLLNQAFVVRKLANLTTYSWLYSWE